MKKGLISLLFILSIFSVFTTQTAFAYNSKEYRYSEIDEYNVIYGYIENDNLYLNIKQQYGNNACRVSIGNMVNTDRLSDKEDTTYELNISLSNLEKKEYKIDIRQGIADLTIPYHSYLSRNVVINYDTVEGWVFKKGAFTDKNEEIRVKTEEDYKLIPVSDTVKEYSNSITEGATSDIDKVAKIYSYIVNNIAYDKKSYNQDINTYRNPETVLKEGHSVCLGMSLTFQALCAAQGIPSVVYSGYDYTANGELNGGHAWNEVYLNDIWYCLDVTWDAKKEYYGVNATKTVSGYGYDYFLVDINDFSYRHEYEGLNTYSSYVKSVFDKIEYNVDNKGKLLESVYNYFNKGTVTGNLTRDITREEFCVVLYDYLNRQLQDMGTYTLSYEEVLKILKSEDIRYNFSVNNLSYKVKSCLLKGLVLPKNKNSVGLNDYMTRKEVSESINKAVELVNVYNPDYAYPTDLTIKGTSNDTVSIEEVFVVLNDIYAYNYNRD